MTPSECSRAGIPAPAPRRGQRASTRHGRARAGACLFALAAWPLLAACLPQKIVLEERNGVEISLRDERIPPREPPGPDFAQLDETQVERSLRRVVIRYSKVVLFVRSEPVPLFTDEQRETIRDVLLRELPGLPADKRLGFAFLDQYQRNEVDVEIYPEGEYLVYDFRSLLRRSGMKVTMAAQAVNLAILFPQRYQVVEEGSHPLLKDPIASVVQPDFRMKEGEEEQESPL